PGQSRCPDRRPSPNPGGWVGVLRWRVVGLMIGARRREDIPRWWGYFAGKCRAQHLEARSDNQRQKKTSAWHGPGAGHPSGCVVLCYGLSPLLILPNTSLTRLPSKDRIPITTIAISTKISAYSTRPWPSSLAKKLRRIAHHLLS